MRCAKNTNRSSSFAFLEPANDVLINLSSEFLEIEQHEHGRADALNLIDERTVDVAQHNHRFRLRNLLVCRGRAEQPSIWACALECAARKPAVRDARADL